VKLAGLHCAVLGGGGFIGLNLVAGLLAAGARVTAIGRRPPPGLEIDGVAWVEAEFADMPTVAAGFAGADIVYHLLGGSVPARSNADPAGDVLGSLLPSIQLLEACRAGRVGRLVFASSGGTVYGPDAPTPTPEDAPTHPVTSYGVNKLAVESYIGLYRHLHGLDGIALRIANPYGPFQHQRRPQGIVGTALARALCGDPIEIWGDGAIVRDFVYVGDVVDAMLAVAGYRGREWLFNVGSGEGRAVRDVVADVCALTGRRWADVRHLPGRAVDVPVNILDSSRLMRETGWAPRTAWSDGLAATARWLTDAAR
jgi:UDP-glucose 4-epimerase